MIRVLFIDDDGDAHRLMKLSLPAGFTLISATTGQAGLRIAERARPDVVLLDMDLPDLEGLSVLSRIRRIPAPPPVIMITGYGEIPLAVRSIRAGATDFLEKPYERPVLLEAIRRAAHFNVTAEQPPPYTIGFLGDSADAACIRSLIRRYAGAHHPVLITGESGTGKDLVATLIHHLSPVREGPFVAKNCGAIPETLLESELFGSERGAYTDAVSRPGSFELADGGTLFLDELGEMPPSAQAKLLRVLEEGRVTRIGARQSRAVRVRVICATNRPISRALEDGALRSDLYYRVSTLPIHIPPLRLRREDIAVLVQRKLESAGRSITPEALEKLMEHDWPGNVRELFNVIERGLLLSDGKALEASAVDFGPAAPLIDAANMVRPEHRHGGSVVHVE